jgi:hypothetical protein
VFKAVFTRDTEEANKALMSLIEAYTGGTVATLTVKQNEPAVNDIGERQVRFDISVKYNDGKLANVEMNMNAQNFDLWRGEFYLDELHTSQNIKGVDKDYSDLKDTWQISFMNNRVFFKDAAIVHKFEYYDKENKVSLGGKTHMVTVELDKTLSLDRKEPEKINEGEKWAYTFKYCAEPEKRGLINKILEQEEGIAMAVQSLLTISKDENERARLMTIQKNILDWQSGIASAKKEGVKIGQEQGIKIGQEQGIKIGQEQGIKIGQEQGIKIGQEQGIKIGQEQSAAQLAAQAAEIAALKRQLGQA